MEIWVHAGIPKLVDYLNGSWLVSGWGGWLLVRLG